ncbi:MAG: AAA family ATPase [Sphingomonas sp.]|nr:AAA family ATPase [Sphingomonas sp.]
MADPATPAQIASFRAALTSVARLPQQSAELARHADKLEVRAGMGRMRRLAGESVDVLFDLALPLMELLRSGRKAEANMLANRYLDVAPQGASGWAMLPFYISLRASLAGDEGFAAAALADAPPRMVVIGGLSGTGKSTLARLIGARLGRLPGARVLRSDVLRKRLAGVGPETRLPPRHYTLRNDAETYEALFESAYEHLSCGSSVILDAVFMSRSERDVVEALAARLRVPFSGIWLDAPERDRIARVNERLNDASDATAEVVREQSRRSVGELAHWHRIRVNRPIELIVAAARGFLERDLR